MSFFDSYRTVWVFYPVSKAIAWSDILVYSYLAYQDRLGKTPTDSRIAWATGLCRQTIPRVLERLKSLRLYGATGPSYTPHTFRNKKGNGHHWSLELAYWKCLVKTEGSPLNVASTMVFSYLLDKKLAGYTPSQGWSYSYLAGALGMDRRTVESSLNVLAKCQLFQADGRRWRVPSSLVGMQPAWFAKIQDNITLDSFEPDLTKVDLTLDGSDVTRDEVDTSKSVESATDARNTDVQVIGDRYYRQIVSILGDDDALTATRDFLRSSPYDELFCDGVLRPDWENMVDSYAMNRLQLCQQ